MIETIFQICILPLLGALTFFIVKWINAKSAEIKTEIDDATLAKYIDMLEKIVVDCVVATNQTYVDSLKAQGKFDAKAQEEAFRRTKEAILLILNDDAKEILSIAFGDLEVYIIEKIEAEVYNNKN